MACETLKEKEVQNVSIFLGMETDFVSLGGSSLCGREQLLNIIHIWEEIQEILNSHETFVKTFTASKYYFFTCKMDIQIMSNS